MTLKRKTKAGTWMGEDNKLKTGSSKKAALGKCYFSKDPNEVTENTAS